MLTEIYNFLFSIKKIKPDVFRRGKTPNTEPHLNTTAIGPACRQHQRWKEKHYRHTSIVLFLATTGVFIAVAGGTIAYLGWGLSGAMIILLGGGISGVVSLLGMPSSAKSMAKVAQSSEICQTKNGKEYLIKVDNEKSLSTNIEVSSIEKKQDDCSFSVLPYSGRSYHIKHTKNAKKTNFSSKIEEKEPTSCNKKRCA